MTPRRQRIPPTTPQRRRAPARGSAPDTACPHAGPALPDLWGALGLPRASSASRPSAALVPEIGAHHQGWRSVRPHTRRGVRTPICSAGGDHSGLCPSSPARLVAISAPYGPMPY